MRFETISSSNNPARNCVLRMCRVWALRSAHSFTVTVICCDNQCHFVCFRIFDKSPYDISELGNSFLAGLEITTVSHEITIWEIHDSEIILLCVFYDVITDSICLHLRFFRKWTTSIGIKPLIYLTIKGSDRSHARNFVTWINLSVSEMCNCVFPAFEMTSGRVSRISSSSRRKCS
jgi:hypothetical protein